MKNVFQEENDKSDSLPESGSIEFRNLKPWLELKLESDLTLEKIENHSPSDARVCGEMEQVEGGYLCRIWVVSPVWKFDVREFARHPLAALHRAANSVERELNLWRRWRFIEV